MMKYIQYILGFGIGVILTLLIVFLSWKFIISPEHNKDVKRLENIIQEQNKTIEKLGSIEKYNYKYDIHEQNKIKNK